MNARKLFGFFAIAIAMTLATLNTASAIDLNTATAMELDNSDLMRVGPAMAKRIVDERTMNGPFKDANDLMSRVSGVGTRFLEQNAGKLEFSGGTAPAPAAPAATAPAATMPAAPAPVPGTTAPAPAAPAQ